MSVVIAIPSRLGSTRLPNKPLADIEGLPMIVRVLNQAKKTGISDIYVAAAEPEIIKAVEDNGGQGVLTSPELPSGTDRIYQGLMKLGYKGKFKYIVNVQGDLPTVAPQVIKDCINLISDEDYDFDIVTAVALVKKEEEKTNPNVVKAVVSWKDEKKKYGEALYFSRATVPHGEGDLWHHIGLYAYKASALEKFVNLLPSELEKREKLEQLRALENNMKIGVVRTEDIPLGVDTPEDLEKAREVFRDKK